MINIRNIRLHMPAGFEGRANNISILLAESLQKINVNKAIKLDSLNINGINATQHMLDHQIADVIFSGIEKSLGEEE